MARLSFFPRIVSLILAVRAEVDHLEIGYFCVLDESFTIAEHPDMLHAPDAEVTHRVTTNILQDGNKARLLAVNNKIESPRLPRGVPSSR